MHPYLRLELVFEAAGDAGRRLPQVPSPLLRRVLGKALVDRFCPFGRPLCQEPRGESSERSSPLDRCTLAESCPYGVLFASSLTSRPPFALFVPPPEGPGAIVELTLFAAASPLHPWALLALRDALAAGIGRRRRRLHLVEVRRIRPNGSREPIAGQRLDALSTPTAADLFDLGFEPQSERSAPVSIELLSPTRLTQEGRILPGDRPIPFDLLIARTLDRFASLYGAEASELLHPDSRARLLTAAAEVPLLRDSTRWVEVEDYSARAGSELLLGGKVGSLLYGAEAAPFLPILRVAEILHVGKNAASGCGRLRAALASGGDS